MSGAPKKGSVAGQPIKTGAQSKEFDEGHERIFGTVRSPERGRFIYRDGRMVRVGEDWTDTERRAQTATEEVVYGKLQASDGSPLDTRRKHREYKAEHGLADMTDYSNHIEKAESKRAEFYRGEGFDQGLSETIGRTMYEARKKGRR